VIIYDHDIDPLGSTK